MANAVDHTLVKNVAIPLSLVGALLGAAVSYGVMYNKVDELQNLVEIERQDRKEDVKELKETMAAVNDNLLEFMGKKHDVSFNK